MRTIATVIVLLVTAHLFAATTGFLWLAASDRLNRDRVEAVVDLFKPTITAQAQNEAEQERLANEAAAQQAQLIRMEEVANGPQSLEDRLAQKLQGDDFALHRLARMQEESSAIQTRLDQDRAYVDAQLNRLETERAAFEQAKLEHAELMQQADFKQAVKMLEQLKGRQAKTMLQNLLADGQMDLVVDYLAAMNLRKSAGVLKEFRTPEEAAVAMQILENLRKRGVDMTDPQLAGANP